MSSAELVVLRVMVPAPRWVSLPQVSELSWAVVEEVLRARLGGDAGELSARPFCPTLLN